MWRLWSRSKARRSRAADLGGISFRRRAFGDFFILPPAHSLLPKSADRFQATCSCSTAQIPTLPGCIQSVSIPSSEGADLRDCFQRPPNETQSAEAGKRCGLKYARTIAAQCGFTRHPVIGTSASGAATTAVTSTPCALPRRSQRNCLRDHESFTEHAHSRRRLDYRLDCQLGFTVDNRGACSRHPRQFRL